MKRRRMIRGVPIFIFVLDLSLNEIVVRSKPRIKFFFFWGMLWYIIYISCKAKSWVEGRECVEGGGCYIVGLLFGGGDINHFSNKACFLKRVEAFLDSSFVVAGGKSGRRSWGNRRGDRWRWWMAPRFLRYPSSALTYSHLSLTHNQVAILPCVNLWRKTERERVGSGHFDQ